MKKGESKKQSSKLSFSSLVIPISLVVAFLIFNFIMGNSSNFEGNNHDNSPLPGNFLGIIYKGGMIVPILITLLLTVITFVIERFIAINKASGNGSVSEFVREINHCLAKNDLVAADAACDKQKGSVANVVKSVLAKYKFLEKDQTQTKDQKIASLEKEVEEATSLELPSLEQNLTILATITSLATLIGLLGTVIGMIRAFAALANAGAPDSIALANGISEALVNTAFGIGSAAIALIFYNFFTAKIDKLTYSIDEAGYSIVKSYATNHAS
jgi:biopolymer transport protein ExbB